MQSSGSARKRADPYFHVSAYMPIILSVIVRAILFGSILYVALWLGVGVAMGFDAGISLFPSLIAFLYLFTFIPALLLCLIPLSKLTKPPFILKVWYWWIALFAAGYAILWVLNFSKILVGASTELLSRTFNNKSYVTICRQVVDSRPDDYVGIGIGNKHQSVRLNARTVRYCSTESISNAPFQVLLGDPQNPRVLLDIPVTGGEKTCVGLSPHGTEWTARVIDCGR